MCLGPPKMAIIAQRFNAGLSLQRGHESRWDERNSRKLGKILSSLPGLKHWPFPRTQPSKGWAIFRSQCVGTLNTYNLAGAVDRKSGPKINNLTIYLSRRSPAIAGRRRNDVTNFIDHTLRFGQSQTSCADC